MSTEIMAARSLVPFNAVSQRSILLPKMPTLQPDTKKYLKDRYTIRDFQIIHTLGTGSFGKVNLVQSVHDGRFYAIKLLEKAEVVKRKQVQHTNDELHILKNIKFPFLVELWGTFQDSSNLFMVMEYVEGGELFALLRRSQRFPSQVARFYASQVVLAIEYLHTKGIIYRDLKPENILLDKHGYIKIVDFGFSKEINDKTCTFCGTPEYIAPEVIASKPYNISVDWWSLGVLIFEMLTGYTPFFAETIMKTYRNILQREIQYPSFLEPLAIDLLQRLITRDVSLRLGNMITGARNVKAHPWFGNIVWEKLVSRSIQAPYQPILSFGHGDPSLFGVYPEKENSRCDPGPDIYAPLFPDF